MEFVEHLERTLNRHRISASEPVLDVEQYVRVPACWVTSITLNVKAITAGQLSYYGGIWTTSIPPPVQQVLNPSSVVGSRGRQWVFLPVPRTNLPTSDLNRFYFVADADKVEDYSLFDPKNCIDGLTTDEDVTAACCSMENICRIADSASYRAAVQAAGSAATNFPDTSTERTSRSKMPSELSERIRWYANLARLGAADSTADPNYMIRLINTTQLRIPQITGSSAINCDDFVLLPFPVQEMPLERRKRTPNEVDRFLAANAAAFKGLPDDSAARGLAARYHVANTGLIFTDIEEDRKWTEVADVQCEPTREAICVAMGVDKAVIEAADIYVESELFRLHSLTLASIKYIMWRQHGHTTGGPVAVGLTQRMLSAFGWQQDSSMWSLNRELAYLWTAAYFRAFDPVSPHLASFWLQRNRCESFARIHAKYGVLDAAPLLPSILQRLLGAEIGVAGTNGVTDVMSGLVVMQSKYVLPAVQGYSQLPALCAKFEEAKWHGLLAGSAQNWWTKHADNGLSPSGFQQYDPTIATVCADVASYILDGVRHQKLRRSDALRTLSTNAPPGRSGWWRDFVRVGRELTAAQTFALCVKIQSRLGNEPLVINLIAEDSAVRTAAFQTLEGIVGYIAGTHENITPGKYEPINPADLEAIRSLAVTLTASVIELNQNR